MEPCRQVRVITNHGDQNSNKKKRGRVSRPSRQQAAWYGSTDIQLKSTPLLVSTRLLCKQGKTTVRAGQDYCASRTRPLCEQDKTTVQAGQDHCASRARLLCEQDKTTVRAGNAYSIQCSYIDTSKYIRCSLLSIGSVVAILNSYERDTP